MQDGSQHHPVYVPYESYEENQVNHVGAVASDFNQ